MATRRRGAVRELCFRLVLPVPLRDAFLRCGTGATLRLERAGLCEALVRVLAMTEGARHDCGNCGTAQRSAPQFCALRGTATCGADAVRKAKGMTNVGLGMRFRER
eukprot:5682527-Prymnesium_polylepis.1